MILVLATSTKQSVPVAPSVGKTGGSYSTALAATAESRAPGDVPEVSRTEGHWCGPVEETKCSPHRGGTSLETPWLATCWAHKASRKAWLLRSGQKAATGSYSLRGVRRQLMRLNFPQGQKDLWSLLPVVFSCFLKNPNKATLPHSPPPAPTTKKHRFDGP